MNYLLMILLGMYVITMLFNLIIAMGVVYKSITESEVLTIGDIIFILFILMIAISPIGAIAIWIIVLNKLMSIRIK